MKKQEEEPFYIDLSKLKPIKGSTKGLTIANHWLQLALYVDSTLGYILVHTADQPMIQGHQFTSLLIDEAFAEHHTHYINNAIANDNQELEAIKNYSHVSAAGTVSKATIVQSAASRMILDNYDYLYQLYIDDSRFTSTPKEV